MSTREVITIDIIKDILVRPDALNTYLGEEVNDFLNEKLKDITVPTLVQIDFRKANPIDYLFVKAAFGQLYRNININKLLDAIFFIQGAHEKNFFWGLLACHDGNIHRTGNYKADFQSLSFLKVCINEYTLEFVGTKSIVENKILDYVNKEGMTSPNNIYEYLKQDFSLEVISNSIKSLADKKFIYLSEGSMPQEIFSIKPKILLNANQNRLS